MSDLECWIWFSGLRSLRFRTRRALLERYGGARELWFSDRREIATMQGLLPEERRELLHRDSAEAERIVRRCTEEHVRILTFQDAAYPARLRSIPDPPYVLYLLGEMPAVDALPVIAVVGTRHSTAYGDKMARMIAGEIAACGGVIATGLAAGIDSRAAYGALDAGGTVIGVLGVAINRVYPSANGPLYDRVRERGVLISEYPPDAEAAKENFPQRNRIIAGLSLGVVVPEAPERSGALITAHKALDYGRDVFAVPSNADSPKGRGSNRLLQEGAGLVLCGWDVMECYAPHYPDRIRKAEAQIPEQPGPDSAATEEKEPGKDFFLFRVPGKNRRPDAAGTLAQQLSTLTEQQLRIVGVMNSPSMHVDDIIDLTQLPASAVLSELTMLQIKGFVSQEQGKRFTLNISK